MTDRAPLKPQDIDEMAARLRNAHVPLVVSEPTIELLDPTEADARRVEQMARDIGVPPENVQLFGDAARQGHLPTGYLADQVADVRRQEIELLKERIARLWESLAEALIQLARL